MSDDQDGCEWVNVSSGVVRVVLDKGQLNGRLCVVYVTVGRPSVCLSVCLSHRSTDSVVAYS